MHTYVLIKKKTLRSNWKKIENEKIEKYKKFYSSQKSKNFYANKKVGLKIYFLVMECFINQYMHSEFNDQ